MFPPPPVVAPPIVDPVEPVGRLLVDIPDPVVVSVEPDIPDPDIPEPDVPDPDMVDPPEPDDVPPDVPELVCAAAPKVVAARRTAAAGRTKCRMMYSWPRRP